MKGIIYIAHVESCHYEVLDDTEKSLLESHQQPKHFVLFPFMTYKRA